MPRVSVIIPTYNRRALIGETLDSVFAQTFREYEIIVVDDGSTDDTQSFLARLHPQVHYCRIDHAGDGAARNAGMELARGEFIAFLDSDDLWAPHFLERMVRTLDAAPDAGFVYCDYAMFDDQGLICECYLPSAHKRGGDVFGLLLETDFLCVGAVLLRRARAGALRFDPTIPVVNDWGFWLRLAHLCTAAYLDEPLVRIRVNRTSTSRNPAIVYPNNLLVLAGLRRDLPDETRRYRARMRRQELRFHRALFNYYRVHRQPLPAVKHLAQMGCSLI